MRHVLVPVDRSAPAARALEYALEEYSDSPITVLHVINPSEVTISMHVEGSAYADALRDRAREAAEQLLADVTETAAARGATVRTAVEIGSPARAIPDYAERNDVTHIVIGNHGRRGASRVLLGSVAETVARRSPVPVTIVR